ncbi:MAG: hypothetical protein OXC65_15865 [Thiotrichales bacterium]|nr:hypothetical protein [Thiotrichales bacterium]
MSAATSFNALAMARELETTGLERRQAEAIAEGMRQAANADRDALVTKTDLAALETRLVKWGYGLGAAVVALTVTLNAGLMYAMLRVLPLAGSGP